MDEIRNGLQDIFKCVLFLAVLFVSFRQVVLESTIERMLPRKITVTAYTSMEKYTNEKPFETAYLEPVKNWMVACSNDLRRDGWLKGDHVYLFSRKNGRDYSFGMFRIGDSMHPRKTEHCDIYVPTEELALKIGRTENVWAILVKKRELI